MIPEIEKSVKLWKPDLTISKLKAANLEHFLPAKTVREHFLKHTKRREIVSLMHTYNNDPKYGIKPSEGVRNTQNKSVLVKRDPHVLDFEQSPQKESAHKSETTQILSAAKPREDHIILPDSQRDFFKTF